MVGRYSLYLEYSLAEIYVFYQKNIAGETGHQVLSVTQKGIVPKNMTERGQFSLDYSKYQLVEAGDFVMNHMDLLTGWVDISNTMVSPVLTIECL